MELSEFCSAVPTFFSGKYFKFIRVDKVKVQKAPKKQEKCFKSFKVA